MESVPEGGDWIRFDAGWIGGKLCEQGKFDPKSGGGGGCGDENFLWSYFLPSCPSAVRRRLRSSATVVVVTVVAIAGLGGWSRRREAL